MVYGTFIESVLAEGRLTFSRQELISRGVSPELVKRTISRYTQLGKLYSIRQGFYAIVTPEFSTQNRVPEVLFIDDLMKYLRIPYYVSLLSAAALHGAGHQQPMSFFVTQSGTKIRDIETGKYLIDFTLSQHWESESVMSLKTRTGYIQVSTPEATIFDLVISQKKIGLGRSIEVIQELTDIIQKSKMRSLVRFYPVAIRQRVGYILDFIGVDSTIIESSLKSEILHKVPFSLSKPRVGTADEKWKVIMNETITTDIL
ncbi:hypothetical protein SJDPG12_08790 [Porphyromonas gingivalis SJD12]|uniref:type IV toxin-antitoxin system AbiEi family antitoxin domain-containing protein n=1 Tax=Porphyromonas gingivalis TaxID=837 RepID=UPI000B51248C|nr:type IV toxin-antitoxin system AbiEi family antitoxin [Porphyromonas gingivalis]OWR81555.1 hypothetical protein SJDPG12_08790 [Porphyromonas gingivalis SJD12]